MELRRGQRAHATVLQPSLTPLRSAGAPWFALIGLGLLLPTIFLALGVSVRHAGIVRSDAAQRLSLMVSLIAAFLLFGAQLTVMKEAGIALGVGSRKFANVFDE